MKTSYGYIASKIAHMKRIGVVSGASNGIGKNGGACPDWLKSEQKDRDDKQADRA